MFPKRKLSKLFLGMLLISINCFESILLYQIRLHIEELLLPYVFNYQSLFGSPAMVVSSCWRSLAVWFMAEKAAVAPPAGVGVNHPVSFLRIESENCPEDMRNDRTNERATRKNGKMYNADYCRTTFRWISNASSYLVPLTSPQLTARNIRFSIHTLLALRTQYHEERVLEMLCRLWWR